MPLTLILLLGLLTLRELTPLAGMGQRAGGTRTLHMNPFPFPFPRPTQALTPHVQLRAAKEPTIPPALGSIPFSSIDLSFILRSLRYTLRICLGSQIPRHSFTAHSRSCQLRQPHSSFLFRRFPPSPSSTSSSFRTPPATREP